MNPAFNPFCFGRRRIFNSINNRLPVNGRRFLLDARLDTPGLPQSASGQTTIYTGVNAAQLIGKHLFGHPNQALRRLLATESLFIKLQAKEFSCCFINAFRPIFFSTPQLFTHQSLSATTEMNRAAHLPFSTLDQIRKHQALYHDFTNSNLRKLGFNVPLFSPRQAAKILAEESKRYDLLLYEYFLTDMAGHSQNMAVARQEVEKVEGLLWELISLLEFHHTTLVVVSDHGNLEDLSTKSHTYNPAYLGVWGKGKSHSFQSLLDVAPFIIKQIQDKG